ALAMIRDGFGYTLDTPLPGRHAADEFLFDWKRGFCEHFSSAFVILMRAAGIPARIVTGYVGGYRNPIGDYWVVRRNDAHAWAEVWLAGRGWVRVDPTAAVAPEHIYDTIDDRASGGGLAGLPGITPVLDFGDWLRRGWNGLGLGFDAPRQVAILRPIGLERTGGLGACGAGATRVWAGGARRTNRRCNGWNGSRPHGPGTPARCGPSGGASRNGATLRPPPRTLAGWHATCGDTARLESRSVSPV